MSSNERIAIMMENRYGKTYEEAMSYDSAVYDLADEENPAHIVDILRSMTDTCEAEGIMHTPYSVIDGYLDGHPHSEVVYYILLGLRYMTVEAPEWAYYVLNKYLDEDTRPVVAQVYMKTDIETQIVVANIARQLARDDEYVVAKRAKTFMDICGIVH